MIRRARKPSVDDTGTTLSELVIVMVIFSVVVTLAAGIAINGIKAQQRTVTRGEALAEQKTAFERMTRSIREADPLMVAEPTKVSLQTVDGGTTKIFTWSLVTSGGKRRLVMDEVRGGTPQPQQVLIENVSSAAPGFTFSGEFGSLAAAPPPSDVTVVSIDLSVPAEPSTHGLFDRVQLRNT